jgi:hypothetical protein
MWNRKRAGLIALVALGAWACSPDDYPTESRFDPPPEEVELPDGELFFYTPPAGVTVTSVSVPGEFNGWNPGDPAAQMIELPDGRWVAGIDLEPGTYQYKFHFNHDASGAGGDWAGNMCDDAVWGNPDFGGKVDSALVSCDPGGNGIRTVGTPGHTFLYIPPTGVDVEVVTVAGNFQDPQWDNQSDTLANIWEYTVDLAAGTYQYKYQFNETNGWAGNMCDEANWGNPEFGNAVDPDNDNCNGENAVITVEAGPHTFRYIVPEGQDSISQITIAGEFQSSQWTPGVDFFTETFQRTYELAPGTYEYKFIFDGNWAGNMCAEGTYAAGGMVDENGQGCVAGGENAQLVIQ